MRWISWLMLITAPDVIMVTNSYNLDRRGTAPEVRLAPITSRESHFRLNSISLETNGKRVYIFWAKAKIPYTR